MIQHRRWSTTCSIVTRPVAFSYAAKNGLPYSTYRFWNTATPRLIRKIDVSVSKIFERLPAFSGKRVFHNKCPSVLSSATISSREAQ